MEVTSVVINFVQPDIGPVDPAGDSVEAVVAAVGAISIR
jgi:hypothetical protein